MIPNPLQHWTINHIVQLAGRGVYESDSFDLKETIPHPSDLDGKHRLRKTCAAFANSTGGFLIFGVTAQLTQPATERLIGIDAIVDFPIQFGNFPSSCLPSVEWSLKTLTLSTDSNRVIHIVYIPQSWKAPHAVADGDAWVFPKRTNKGTEPMSYSEIRNMFLGYYEKRIKLQLLRAELVPLQHLQARMGLSQDENNLFQSHLPEVQLQVIENVLDDTYSITHANPALLNKLAELRQEVRSLNSLTETLRLSIAVYPSAGLSRVRIYLPTLNTRLANIEQYARDAIRELDNVIGTV